MIYIYIMCLWKLFDLLCIKLVCLLGNKHFVENISACPFSELSFYSLFTLVLIIPYLLVRPDVAR